jgi:glycosyltransferase involved in cell wall biosynthesis
LKKVWDCGGIMRPEKHRSAVMFEALGCGKPFVGTKVGGVPENITSEVYGFLVEPANSEELAEKILIASDKEWDYEKILRYAERFRWENIVEEIMRVYKETLNWR